MFTAAIQIFNQTVSCIEQNPEVIWNRLGIVNSDSGFCLPHIESAVAGPVGITATVLGKGIYRVVPVPT
jgi:hypothetical protein